MTANEVTKLWLESHPTEDISEDELNRLFEFGLKHNWELDAMIQLTEKKIKVGLIIYCGNNTLLSALKNEAARKQLSQELSNLYPVY